MKLPIGLLAALVAGLLTTSCDSSQGLFNRRRSSERSEQTNRTLSNQRPNSDLGRGRSQQQDQATNERQAKNPNRGEDIQQKSQSLKETLQAKSRQIKAAIEGPTQAEPSNTRRETNQSTEEVADNGEKNQSPDQDTTDDAAFEQRIRQRLGLSHGSTNRDDERYSNPDTRSDDRERLFTNQDRTNEKESSTGAYPTDRAYGDNDRNDTRRIDDFRSDDMDSRTAAGRSTERSRPPASDRYRDSRRYADEGSDQDRYPGGSIRKSRYRNSEDRYPVDRYPVNPSDRDESDHYRWLNDDRPADARPNSNSDPNRRREGGNTDPYAADRQLVADRISEQVDALDQHLDSLDQLKSKSSVTTRPVRQGLGKQLEKQRDELMKVYYQVERGSAQNWKQIKRQADRLIYDAEEKLEQITVKKSE